MEFDRQQAIDLIRHRRSIKPADFSSRIIDNAIVEQLLECATWAPTHGMTEPWRFTVFCGAARDRVGTFLADVYREVTAVENFKSSKYEKLKRTSLQASHVIAIGMKRQDSEKIPEIEEVEAVACAVQNLHLAATAHGIAGYWSSGTAICSNQFRQFIGLTERDRVLGVFYLGYTDVPWPSSTRQPVRDKVIWHTS